MCIPSAPRAPAPPPPPPAPPAPPKTTDPAVKKAKTRSRSVAALAVGRTATLLGGPAKDEPESTATPKLLGT